MQQAIHRLRWPGEQRNPVPHTGFHRIQTNKPLPPLADYHQPQHSRRATPKSPRMSPLRSPIPTISVDDSACTPDLTHAAQPHYIYTAPASTRARTRARRSSFHPTTNSSLPLPSPSHSVRHFPHSPHHPHSPSRRIQAHQVRAAVLSFLEQQEHEMRAEVVRVGSEIRDLRRCVRAVRRERGAELGVGAGRRMGMEESGSGSDADTEEMTVVVIAAD